MAERIVIKNLEKTLQGYDDLDAITQRHLTRYFYARNLLSPEDKVLDIACGSGYGSKLLGEHGCKVIGVDVSLEAIELSNKYNSHANVQFRQGSIYDFPSFMKKEEIPLNGIISFETLEHISEGQEEILQKFKSAVFPNSPVICSIPLNHPDTKWHKRIFSWDDRDELFRGVFDRIDYPEENGSLVVGWA